MKQELKCPKCGKIGTLIYQNIQQAALEHKVTRAGKISKTYKYVKIGPEEWSIITCTECGGYWTDTQGGDEGFFVTPENEILFYEPYEDEEE